MCFIVRLPILTIISLLFVSFLSACTSYTGATTEDMGAPSPSPVGAASTVKGGAVSTSVSVKSMGGHESVQSGTLTAGEIDDNLNFSAFQKYSERARKKSQNGQLPVLPLNHPIHIQVVDSAGRGMSNARLRVAGRTFYTRADGHFYFYPGVEVGNKLVDQTGHVKVALLPVNPNVFTPIKTVTVSARGARPIFQKITLPGQQNTLPKALDLMFVIDTTGSMTDEIRYVKTELKSIISRVKRLYPETVIRYGLVVYRDKGDDYVVRDYGFKDSLQEMQALLAKQQANGGGDYPEALDAAVEKAVREDWGKGNRARVMFLIADAPPHEVGYQAAIKAAKIAHQKGIRIYPIGASGVADNAEYIMRHMALLSNGRYQFLTDDSGVGNAHEEPHVPCYVVTRLDHLITRTISAELSGRHEEPSQGEIIRQVGNYDNGVCRPVKKEQQTN